MTNDTNRIPWGDEKHWPTTYTERITQKQEEIEDGGRGNRTTQDVQQELEQFKQNTTPEQYNSRRCHDCGAAKGNLHRPGCDVEECPICGGQLITCAHAEQILSAE